MSGAETPRGLRCDVVVPGRLRAALDLPPGEVVAVLGPNGAGKSTLLHAVAGLLGDVGPVEVAGRRWSGAGRPPVLVPDRRLGMAFQGQLLFPHLTALENVAFGLRTRGASTAEAAATARDWLARFGIEDLAGRRPRQLSGGQAQRVALARALAPGPSLLLLDEPFAGLDVGVATALRADLVRHLAPLEAVTLVVTHDAVDAAVLASRILVVQDGEVVQEGAPGEVLARPATAHVARLVGLNVIEDDPAAPDGPDGPEGGAGRLGCFRPSAVAVSLEEPTGSPRRRWAGVVTGVVRHGDLLRVEVATDAGPVLVADLTPEAGTELALDVGRRVWLAVKATAIDWQPAR
ncbi:ABC transporter ATP-binding protein [Nocardioides sp.]|uniref:ABC transporter ATP-binding protein n=1 Tax=Nocardioides sp. TaxID=35761 RepID=UPI003514E0AE